jgi:TonB family protein
MIAGVVLSMVIGVAAGRASEVIVPLNPTESEGLAAAIVHPVPVYTKTALHRRLEGRVRIGVYVDQQGSVYDTVVAAGDDELVRMAISAVQAWKFRPFLNEKGEPAKAMVPVVFDFRLPAKIAK